ncbi:MAG: nucleotidyltransferase domain-containing protein [Anaerobacillus sp.]
MSIISEKLVQIERTEDITILYACDAGSRALGYNASGSDYDVRFVYVHRPEWYLSVFVQKEVVDHSVDNMEFHGWDIRKALKLIKKSNPSLLEWLASPIVYKEKEEVKQIRTLGKYCFSSKTLLLHYIKMGKTNLKAFTDRGDHKLLLYSLKSVLYSNWIREHHSLPEDTLHHLVNVSSMDERLKVECLALLDRKTLLDETLMHSFLVKEFEMLEKVPNSIEKQPTVNDSLVDHVFRCILNK